MTVIDLIIKLQQIPPNLGVMFDVTPENAEMFKFVSVDDCEEIEDSCNDKYVLLSCGVGMESTSDN